MNLVRLDTVTKSLGAKPILDAASCRVEAGKKNGLWDFGGTDG
jgi:ATPase subunit of ABC transporter with duplicated ATPase domains